MRLDPFPCQHCGAVVAQTDGFKLVYPSADPTRSCRRVARVKDCRE